MARKTNSFLKSSILILAVTVLVLSGCSKDSGIVASGSTTSVTEKTTIANSDLLSSKRNSSSTSSRAFTTRTTQAESPRTSPSSSNDPSGDSSSKSRPSQSAQSRETRASSVSQTSDVSKATSKEDTSSGQTPVEYFELLSPGSDLPSGEECKTMIRPAPETVPENVEANRTPGRKVSDTYLSTNIEAADFEARIDGSFTTGTTDEIIQWAACKWGLDENQVRATAMTESSWFAMKLGDCNGSKPTRPETKDCASTGITQLRSAEIVDNNYANIWPMSWESTSFNLDFYGGLMRSCYEGREVWHNDDPRASSFYKSGDMEGCIRRHFSGTWNDGDSARYWNDFSRNLNERPWEDLKNIGCENPGTNNYCANNTHSENT